MSIVIDPDVPAPLALEVRRLARQAGAACAPAGTAGGRVRVCADDADPSGVRVGGRGYRLPAQALDLAVALAPVGRGGGRLWVVTGVVGGVGASTLAAAVAASAADGAGRAGPGGDGGGAGVVLVDLDPAPGPTAAALALEEVDGARWADLSECGPYVGSRLVSRLPTWRGVRVLTGDDRGGPAREVAMQAVAAALRTGATVVLDLPRHALAAGELVPWEDEVDALVVVAGSGPEALAALPAFRRALGGLRPTWVLRHTGRAPAPAWLVDRLLPEGVVTLRTDRRLPDALDAGDGPWPPGRSCLRRVAAGVVARA